MDQEEDDISEYIRRAELEAAQKRIDILAKDLVERNIEHTRFRLKTDGKLESIGLIAKRLLKLAERNIDGSQEELYGMAAAIEVICEGE